MGILTIMSLPLIRRKYWELFRNTHLLWPVAIFFAVLHTAKVLLYVGAPLLLLLLDMYYRLDSRRQIMKVTQFSALAGRSAYTQITFERADQQLLTLQPGQFGYIRVPSVSQIEWHPFSIISCPSSGTTTTKEISIIMKSEAVGSWTQRVNALALKHQPNDRTFLEVEMSERQHTPRENQTPDGALTSNASSDVLVDLENAASRDSSRRSSVQLPLANTTEFTAFVASLQLDFDGSYGHPSVDYSIYNSVVLIGGGVGITPLLSMFQYLAANSLEEQFRLGSNQKPSVKLIWTLRDVSLLLHLFPIISKCIEDSNQPEMQSLSAEIYITKPVEDEEEEKQVLALTASNTPAAPVNDEESVSAEQKDEEAAAEQEGEEEPKKIVVHMKERPSLSKLMAAAAADSKHQGVTRMAVVTCGPAVLTTSVQNACLDAEKATGLAIDLSTESFTV